MNNTSSPLIFKASSRLRSLTACLALGIFPYSAYSADIPASDFLEDDFLEESVPIVLTGTRLAQPQGDVPASITVIDRKMIEASGIAELPQIFRLIPGFQIGHGGPNLGYRLGVTYHGNADIFSRRMQVLIDGMSVYTPVFGGINWYELPISINDIEKIEVTRGPNGVTYGANSFAAVINIITRHPSTLQGTYTEAEIGENDYKRVYARHSGQTKEINYRLSLEFQKDTGFENFHDDKQKTFINYRGEYQQNVKNNWQFQFGGLMAPEQTDSSNGPDRDLLINGYFGQAKWSRHLGPENEYSLQFYHNRQNLDDTYNQRLPLTCAQYAFFYAALGPGCVAADATPTYIDIELVQDNNMSRTNLEYQHTKRMNKSLRLVWGAEARHDRVGGSGWFNTDKEIVNNLFRAFLNAEWSMNNKLKINAGTMVENNEFTGIDYSPRIAFNYQLKPKHTLRFVVSKAKRAPSVFEAYTDTFITIGTAVILQDQLILGGENLMPENIISYEIGYFGSLLNNKMTLDVKLFKEETTDLIAIYSDRTFSDANGDTDSFTNDGETSIYGWEMQLKYKPNQNSFISLNYAYGKNEGKLLDRINIDSSRDYDPTDQSTPEHTFGLLAATKFPNQISASTGLYYVSDRHWFGDAGEKEAGYRVLDIKLAKSFNWNKTKVKTAITAQNLLGEYSDINDSINLKRQIYITLGLQFN